MTLYRELLLGCGHSRVKRVMPPGTQREWQNLMTLDINREVKPQVVADLSYVGWRKDAQVMVEYPGYESEKFGASNSFNEIHAYEVLEHLGQQGDARAFFSLFYDFWDMLVPDGYFCATVPSRFSEGLWGDPGHTRAIPPMALVFLDQEQYSRQLDRENPTSMSDYRYLFSGDFRTVDSFDDRKTHSFILQAVKPSRISKK